MCNVVVFQFTCGHTLRLRRSQCNGTKHKVTRTSIKAACTAQSYLTITLRVACGPCQHEKWESDWKLKLRRAAGFLEKLTEKKMVGVDEIAALVQELEHQYTSASWDAQHTFLQAHKPMLPRVRISDYRRVASPLPREVRPEDVVETAVTSKEWADMGESDYDGNYIASTDPIHPVSTDYAHPMDDDDGSWVSNHLSPEEMESCTDVPFTFDGGGWDWGNEGPDREKAILQKEHESGEGEASKWITKLTKLTGTEQGLVAWGPEAETTSSTAEISMQGLTSSKDPVRRERVAEVIKTFWVVVDSAAESDNPSQPSPTNENDKPISHLISSLDICNDPQRSPSSEPPESPASITSTESLLWTDGPADTFSSPEPVLSPPPRPSTPPAPNSTRARYDKSRRFLKERRKTDLNAKQFYSDWLLVARYEARAFEGPGGRRVPDPPVLRGKDM